MADIIQSRLNKALDDKWVLFFQVPTALRKLIKENISSKSTLDLNALQYSLTGLTTPDITVKAISQPYASGNLYVSSHAKDPFELLSVKFRIDNRYANWAVIYNWLNLIHDEKEAYPDPHNLIPSKFNLESYWTNLGLVALDEFNNVKIKMTFTQAFPTKISGLNFNYTDSKEMEATANFAFSQYLVSYPETKIQLKAE